MGEGDDGSRTFFDAGLGSGYFIKKNKKKKDPAAFAHEEFKISHLCISIVAFTQSISLAYLNILPLVKPLKRTVCFPSTGTVSYCTRSISFDDLLIIT